jgi:hypothetical protein
LSEHSLKKLISSLQTVPNAASIVVIISLVAVAVVVVVAVGKLVKVVIDLEDQTADLFAVVVHHDKQKKV